MKLPERKDCEHAPVCKYDDCMCPTDCGYFSECSDSRWIETTDKDNPRTCRGEYRFDTPWLEHSPGGGVAYYSVRKDISGLWESMFWHGNRGYTVNNFKHSKTKTKAKAFCLEHLKKMYAEFSVQMDEIIGGA